MSVVPIRMGLWNVTVTTGMLVVVEPNHARDYVDKEAVVTRSKLS